MYIYLLHFERPLHHARHYLGITEDIARRMADHSSGNGAKITKALKEAGIGFTLVAVWSGATRNDERSLKNMRNTPQICPECNPYGTRRIGLGLKKISKEVLERSGIRTNYLLGENEC